MILTYAQLKGEAQKLIPEADPDIMAAIAMAESGGNTDAISPTGDYGLWQINKRAWESEPNLFGTASGRMFFANGRWKGQKYNAMAARTVYKKQGYNAWTTYKSGKYKSYLQRNVPSEGGGITGAPDAGIPNALVDSPVGAVLETAKKWGIVGGLGIGALVLLVLGVVILLRTQIGNVASTGKAVKAVKALT